MKTNKFTTQKLFTLMLLSMVAISSFAQISSNAAGEPIIEPEADGLSCETAIELQSDTSKEYSIPEEIESIYFEFSADNDSLDLIILESTSTALALINEVEVFLFEECSNLVTKYHHNTEMDSMTNSHIELNNLNIGQNYLVKLSRNPDNEMPESFFQVALLDRFLIPCPTDYNNQCGEFIKNSGFNFLKTGSYPTIDWNTVDWSLARIGLYGAFKNKTVCEWREVGYNGYTFLRYAYNQTFIDSRTYAGLIASSTRSDAIATDINIEPGNYIFSIDVSAHDDSSFAKPDELRIVLNNKTTNNQKTLIIPDTQIQRSTQSIYTVINFNTESICFNTNEVYDEIIIEAHKSSLDTGYVFIDNVSIRPYDLDLGNEYVIGVCESSDTIGPKCVYPQANYSWSPSSGLSDSDTSNPAVNVTNPTEYILSMTIAGSTCPTLTDRVLVSNVDTIPNNTNISQLRTIMGISGNTLIKKTLKLEGTLVIDEDFTFWSCNFYMGNNAKIIVDNDVHLEFDRKYNRAENFMKTCESNIYWDGIYLNAGSRFEFSGSYLFGPHSNDWSYFYKIQNSKNGIIAKDAAIISIQDVQFINNGRVLKVENSVDSTTRATVRLDRLDIRCTSPLTINGVTSYPNHAFEFINLKKEYQFATVETGNWYRNADTSLRINLEGSAGNILVENSEGIELNKIAFTGFNNAYQMPGEPDKSDVAIIASGDNSSAELEINNCSFINNRESIRINDDYSVKITNNYVNASGINDASFFRATDVSNPHTSQADNLNLIHNNTILNVEKGIELYSSTFFRVSNNYFDMEVQADSNSYTQNYNEESVAIYANDYTSGQNPKYPPNDYLIVEGNTIKHCKVGIHHEFVWSSITNNVIKDLNNRFTPPQTCFPIQNPCPITPSYGIRAMNDYVIVSNNLVENDLSQYSGTMPNSQEAMIGISMENVHTPLLTANSFPHYSHFYCNATENTGIGIRLAGFNDLLDIRRNRLQGNKIGFALDNEAYIMDVGTDIYGFGVNDAANEWVGTFGNSHTFNFSNDDPMNPPDYYKSSSSNLVISPTHAAQNFLPINDIVTSNDNTISCTAPLMVNHNSGKKEATTAYNKSGKKPRWLQKGNASDSAFYLRQQLQFYHLSKDSALYNSQQFSSFRDSMKNTTLGRALGKNSQFMRSLSAQNNFDQNVSTVEPLLDKHFSDSVLSLSELDQLRQIAVLCPYTDGIAVYQARRVLHEYGERLYVNECEVSQLPNNQKFIRIKAEEEQDKVPFAIYPNPADEQINISYSVEEDEEIVLEIYDVLGKKIMTKSLNSGHLHQINTSQLQHGVYIYRLFKSKEQINSGKLVIE